MAKRKGNLVKAKGKVAKKKPEEFTPYEIWCEEGDYGVFLKDASGRVIVLNLGGYEAFDNLRAAVDEAEADYLHHLDETPLGMVKGA